MASGHSEIKSVPSVSAQKKITDPYPSLTWDEKIEAYKKGIEESLHYACHPEHLNNVRRKLDYFQEKWRNEWDIK